MEAPRRKDVEDAHEILDKYGKNFVTKVRAQAACEKKNKCENFVDNGQNIDFKYLLCNTKRFAFFFSGRKHASSFVFRKTQSVYLYLCQCWCTREHTKHGKQSSF